MTQWKNTYTWLLIKSRTQISTEEKYTGGWINVSKYTKSGKDRQESMRRQISLMKMSFVFKANHTLSLT